MYPESMDTNTHIHTYIHTYTHTCARDGGWQKPQLFRFSHRRQCDNRCRLERHQPLRAALAVSPASSAQSQAQDVAVRRVLSPTSLGKQAADLAGRVRPEAPLGCSPPPLSPLSLSLSPLSPLSPRTVFSVLPSLHEALQRAHAVATNDDDDDVNDQQSSPELQQYQW